MNRCSQKCEVLLYCLTLRLKRRLDVHQMALLFDRDEKTVRKHIKNALQEELCDEVVVANFATTTKHGAISGKKQTHGVNYYNLDMILSIGYRVKSQRGIDFRKWANMELKNVLLKGYAVNNRLDKLEVKVYKLEEQTKEIVDEIKGQLPPQLDLQKHNSEYRPINIEKFNKSHDRFLIIDDDVYLIGSSLKDFGKKMFGFAKMEIEKDKILSIL